MKFVIALYNSFLKIGLNSDKENMLIIKMWSNLTRVLTYSLAKFVLEDGFEESFALKIL